MLANFQHLSSAERKMKQKVQVGGSTIKSDPQRGSASIYIQNSDPGNQYSFKVMTFVSVIVLFTGGIYYVTRVNR